MTADLRAALRRTFALFYAERLRAHNWGGSFTEGRHDSGRLDCCRHEKCVEATTVEHEYRATLASTPEPAPVAGGRLRYAGRATPRISLSEDDIAPGDEPAPVAEGLDVDRLARARDLVANYCWNEDDSGDEDQIVRAYDLLVEVLGHSTEESVGATLAREYAAASPSPETE